VRDEGFDVLHLHEPMVPGASMTACLLKPVPLVGTFHAAGQSAGYQYMSPALRWLAGRLDARAVVSAEAEALVGEHLGGTYEHLFNGIEVERFAQAEPWPKDGFTIFFLGRHEPRKGLDVLLASMAALPSDVTVWIGSDGPDTDQLKAAHAGDPRLVWLGRLSDEEKRQRLRAADIFCAPSLRGESFGVVLLESMAAETAIVASNLSGYRLVARADQDALLVEPGDVDGLATALNQLIASSERREELVTSGRERAESFSMSLLADKYLEMYERVCSPAPQSRGWRAQLPLLRKP